MALLEYSSSDTFSSEQPFTEEGLCTSEILVGLNEIRNGCGEYDACLSDFISARYDSVDYSRHSE